MVDILQPILQPILRSVWDVLPGVGFSPATLFAAGEQGAWYDPSDLSTLFQDAAGTTPVTASGQPVGRMLDKSGRGNHATQATVAARPTLQADGNGHFYLACDGVDDSMSTGSIDFTATDKMTVVAGVRKDTDVAFAIVFETSATIASNVGAFNLAAPGGAGAPNYSIGVNSAGVIRSASAANGAMFAAPVTSVVSSLTNMAAPLVDIRVNTVTYMQTTASMSGTFGNFPLFLFARNNTSNRLTGRFYGAIIRGALSSAAQLAASEAWVNARTGAY